MTIDLNQGLAAIQQAHESLVSICDPKLVSDIRPKKDRRDHYRNLLLDVLRDINILEREFNEQVFDEKVLHQSLPEKALHYYRNSILPRRQDLELAFDRLDPVLADFFRTVDDVIKTARRRKTVTHTFEVAIDRMVELVNDNPELSDDFEIDGAYRVIESRLLLFDPSAWLLNSDALRTIRTTGHPDVLSMQIRARLVEIYRSYIFGNWLSVLALCRSALECAIIDNASKLGISLAYETMPRSKARNKSLSHLVENVADTIPDILDAMTEIRDLGNEYIHPKKTRRSKERLLAISKEAARSLVLLHNVLETLYGARSRTRQSGVE